jgi:hypothetical protein
MNVRTINNLQLTIAPRFLSNRLYVVKGDRSHAWVALQGRDRR